jgi:arginase
MLVLLNEESNGVGMPNRISSGLAQISSRLTAAASLRPRLRRARDFTPRHGVRALDTIAANATLLQSALTIHRPGQLLYNLGGDCGSELVPIGQTNLHAEGRLQVIWCDAHADLNTPATSPSGAFHGMVLRTLGGEGPALLAPFVPCPLRPANIHFVGLRETDPGELDFLSQHNCAIHSPADTIANPSLIAESLDPQAPVYIHIDYDVLDGTQYPESSYPSPNGLSIETLATLVAAIRTLCPVIGMSLTEYAPLTGTDMEKVDALLQSVFF